ncbi:unnamed protein product [Cochlearia groenlandica]
METTTPPPSSSSSQPSNNEESQNQSLEMVLYSPQSNDSIEPLVPKSKIRLADRFSEMASEDAVARKRGKPKGGGGQKGLLGSHMNLRRSKRRSDSVEDKEANVVLVIDDITVKPRKRKTNKDNHTYIVDESQSDFSRIGEIISDLVMWRDVAKSTLWFGLGCLCFLSSCFSKGLTFIRYIMDNKDMKKKKKKVSHVSEDDVLRLARRFLPATNFVISKTSELFSGEPSMTLKVTPFLLIGAEYGHLITPWRLSAFGFFLSFTIPKLYSCYTYQISQKVERVNTRIGEAWEVCSHKKILVGSAVTAFWNLTSIRTRVFTIFIILVIFQYRRQNLNHPEEVEPVENEKQEKGTLSQEEEEKEETLPVEEEEQTQPPQEEQALVMEVAEAEGSKKL